MANKEQFVKEYESQGHFARATAEVAVNLAEAYCRADLNNRRVLMYRVGVKVQKYFSEVLGWSEAEAIKATNEIMASKAQA